MIKNKTIQLLKMESTDQSRAHIGARVYFTCFPDDFNAHFPTIFHDLGKIAPCRFYYMDPEAADPRSDEELMEQHQADIAEMQLVVVPVTKAFLTEPSLARDVDISLALKLRKPILPIMLGTDLLAIYNENETLNGIHYFDPNLHDNEALDYSEKLKRYLDAILLNDEQYESIRQEFSNHIFLSYRKVDRAFARELMRSIHDIEGCRDVSIWYDEFLTPGEHFDDEIATRIKSSELFAMVITPNIIEKPNYVETHEYRIAEEADRRKLAAEYQSTDKSALKSTYLNLPEVIQGKDKAAIKEALTANGIGCKTNKDSALHLYLIGLAYLNGVEVEVDSEKAVTLLTEAADMNSPEGSGQAMKQLSNMYYNGIGVNRDFETAKSWQIKLTEYLKYKLQHLSDFADTDADIDPLISRYIIECMTLGDYCYDEDLESWAETYYEDITEKIYALTAGGSSSMDYVFNPQMLNSNIANAIWFDATRGATRLAKINFFSDDRSTCSYYYQVEREIEAKLNQYRTNTLYGAFQQELKEITSEDAGSETDSTQKEAEELAASLLKEIDDLLAEQIDNESKCYSERSLGHFQEAVDLMLANVAAAERVVEISEMLDLDKSESQKAILGWYSRAGSLCYENNNYYNAINYYNKSLGIYYELGGNIDMFASSEEKLDIWTNYLNLGQSYAIMANLEDSVEYLRKAVEVCEKIYEKTPTHHWKSNLNKTRKRLQQQESLLNDSNNFFNALLNMAVAQNEPSYPEGFHLYSEEEASELSTEELAEIYKENMAKGDRCLMEKNLNDSKWYYENTLVTSRIMFNRTSKVSDLWNYSFANEGLGTVAMRQQKFKECISYYLEVADKCRIIIKNFELEEAYESLAKAYNCLAMASSKAGYSKHESHNYFDLAYKAWKTAYKKYRKPFYKEKMDNIKDMKRVFK